MNRWLLGLVVALWGAAAQAQGINIRNLPGASPLSANDLFIVDQANGTGRQTRQGAAALILNYVSGSMLTTPNTWTQLQAFSAGVSINVTGTTQCLHVNTAGVISGTGSDCGSGGGGGSPGGASGTVQYNNAGSFGGFTVSGDATLNTTSGVLTVTKTNGSDFVASATVDTTVASNILSGILPAGRLSGSYTGVTGVGTLVAGATGAGFTIDFTASTISGTLGVNRGGTGAATFTANLPLVGNGTSALAQGTRSGSTTAFATVTGALTNGNCVSIDASGNFIDAGGPCTTGGGGGTVSGGTAGQLGYYATSSTTISGNANATISNGALTLGVSTSVIGQLKLAGNTSGTVVITPQAAAGTPTLTIGTNSGTPAVTATAPLAIASSTGNISITGVAGQVLGGASPGFTATPTLGVNASLTGQVILANGGGGGASITIQNNGATVAYNLNLPTTAGAVGALALSGGGGSTANAWLADVAVGQVLISGGVATNPAYSATLPAAVQGNITALGTITSGVWNGTAITGSNIAANTVADSNLAQMPPRSAKCNNSTSTANAANCTSLVLGPTASSLNQGLVVVQSGSGTTGGVQVLYNEISLTDNVDTGNNVASSYALTWYVNQNFGGTNTTGGREASFSNLLQTTPTRSMVTSAPFLTTNGSGYGNTATGTITWSGSGCSTNPALNVTTNSGGGIVTINSITTTGICTTPPSPAATTWTASAGLSAGSGVSLSVTTIAAVGTGYGNTATGTLTWAGSGCTVNPVLNVTTNAGGGVITINSVTTPGTCTVFPISSATTWTAGGGLSAGSGVAFNLANGNSVRFYVAMSGQAQSIATDGGTIGSNREQGRLYGSNFIGVLSNGATGYEQVSAAYDQVWVQAGATVKRKAIHQFLYGGIQGGGGAGDTVQGSTTDAALLVSAEPGATAGGLNGILFTDVAGANPMASTATLIKLETSTTATIDTGIDLSQATITTNFLKSKNYTVSGAGVTTINQNTSSLPSVSAGNLFQLGGADGANTPMTLDSFGGAPVMIVRRADGTNASKTAIQGGDALFQFGGQGYDGASYSGSQVALNFLAGANWSGSSHPTVIAFVVTPVSSTSAATALQINPDGSVNALGTTDATTTASGIVVVAGGMGIAKNIIGGSGVQTGTKTVSGLPTCNSTTKAMKYFVTDATATTFHSTVAGSGANNVGVTCDGTNWYIS